MALLVNLRCGDQQLPSLIDMISEGLVALFGDRCTNIGGGGAGSGCWGRKQCGATKVTIPVTGSTTGAAIVHKEFSHRPPSHRTPNAGLFHLSELVQAAKGQRAEPWESGCSRSLLQTLDAQCYRSHLEFHFFTKGSIPATPYKPNHTVHMWNLTLP